MLTIDEIDSLPFLFIVGRSRSGTTLLQTMLDANPHVILPLESKLIIFLKKKYFHVEIWTTKLIDEFIADLYTEKDFSRSWFVDKEKLRDTILSFPLNKLSFKKLCKIIYLSYNSPFKKKTILLIGDKKPLHSLFIKDLVQVFPEAKFIHIIRDYRDNIVSNRKSFMHKNVAHLAHSWKSFNIAIDKEKQKNESNFYTIKYEDLA
ncbi:MAG TPA: sulfotransferase, partial [Bacteroidia bacterium]|nr:sulfotransferase [Bacteroidia bacterium]